MDIAAIGAAPPPPDASSAAAAGAPDGEMGFAALLDEAAGSDDVSLDVSVTDGGDADDEDAQAALAITSLLSLNVPLQTPGDAVIAGMGGIGDGAGLAETTTPGPSIAGSARIDGDHSGASTEADSEWTVASPAWNANVRTATRSGVTAGGPAPVSDSPANGAGDRLTAGEETVDAGAAGDVAEMPAMTETQKAEAAPPGRETMYRRAAPATEAQPSVIHNQPSTVQANPAAADNAAANHVAAEASTVSARQEATDAPATSRAARLARVLERAAAIDHESAPASPVRAASEDGSGQPFSFDEGAAERDTPSFGAPRQANGGVTFTVAAPTSFDVRALARAVDAAGQAADPAAAPIPEREVVAQLVQSMRVQFRDGIGEAVVRLKPEHLGAVQVSLKIENGAVTATVQAEVASVRHWLESQQDTLRSGLAEQGLRLDRFVVEPDGERHTARDDAQRREQRRQQPRRRESAAMSDTDHPVFEVTV